MARRKIIAIDCETDGFKYGRIPLPFIWCAFDGENYYVERDTEKFVRWLMKQNCFAYAHNGGKFDFLFLIQYAEKTRAKIINGRIAEMPLGKALLRDSWNILPVPLASINKDEVDYSLFEPEVREKYMDPVIIPYLKNDCKYLWDAVAGFRKMAGGRLTIASNAAANAKKLGCGLTRTNQKFDKIFRPYYFGGRTECFQPGEHKNISVIDIVSSYPNAMMCQHPTGSPYIDHAPEMLYKLSTEEIQKSFIELECYSAGAFPFRAENGALEFPHARNVYKISGWEYLIAKKHNLISDEKIMTLMTFEVTAGFKEYIEKWFGLKQSINKDDDPVSYMVSKILLNGLYGKAAQNPLDYFDYKIWPAGHPVDYDNGWTLYTEFENKEIHRRDALYSVRKKYGDEWEKRPVFYNVATGASITGFARAYLLDAIHTIGPEKVIYCDTDSLMLKPCDYSKLPLGDKLGEWELEGTAEIGYFAGKKLYGMNMKNTKGKVKPKVASKGAKLTVSDIKKLCAGKMVPWKNDAPSFSLTRCALPGSENYPADIDMHKFFIKRDIVATTVLPDITAENERIKNAKKRKHSARQRAYERQRRKRGNQAGEICTSGK